MKQRIIALNRRTSRGTNRRAGRIVLVTAVLSWLVAAAAQTEVSGTITGTLDGEPRNWYTLSLATDQGNDGTAWLRNVGNDAFAMRLLEIQGHDEPRFKTEGTLTLGGSIMQPLATCPCAVTEPEIMYFSSSSMFSSVYDTIEATLVVEAVTAADDGTLHLTGNFTAVLGFVEDVMKSTQPDPTRTLAVEGTFDLEQVLQND